MPIQDFCELCQELVKLASHADEDPGAFSLEKNTCFQRTASSCSLCELLSSAIQQQYGEAAFLDYDTEQCLPHNFRIFFNFSRVPGDDDRCSEADIHLESRALSQTWAITLALRAETDTAAARTFITRPPISDNHSLQPSYLISTLLADCVQNHYQCSLSKASNLHIGDDDPELPTRVLEINNIEENIDTATAPTVRLFETDGTRGQYCALSHCWGPPDKRPLRTVRANLAQHRDEIPFDELPRTFREAILFAQRLGVRYLWIDSLCIVQDDQEDWAKEARVMRALYQRALLVIAAAGASDSTGGLFVSDRSELRQIQAPFLVASEEAEEEVGHFNISTVPRGDFMPDTSILRERGWVYQEWYLARRLFFSMPGGFVWSCAEYNLDELGVHIPFEMYESHDWYHLLQGYTSKKLSFASDRLEALRGISEEKRKLGEANNNNNFHELGDFKYGVWDLDLTRHLLWKTVARPAQGQEDLPELPTWTCKLPLVPIPRRKTY